MRDVRVIQLDYVRTTIAREIARDGDDGGQQDRLGLVLGYSSAGSPVVQPASRHAATIDVSCYAPTTQPGARLPHAWLPDGSSLYDRLRTGLTLVGPVHDGGAGLAGLARRARRRGPAILRTLTSMWSPATAAARCPPAARDTGSGRPQTKK
jgi:hypothetical protein